jgi:hypothetical protein
MNKLRDCTATPTVEELEAILNKVEKIPETVAQFEMTDTIGPLYTMGYNDGMAGVVRLIKKALGQS